jgi:hypothetical protein
MKSKDKAGSKPPQKTQVSPPDNRVSSGGNPGKLPRKPQKGKTPVKAKAPAPTKPPKKGRSPLPGQVATKGQQPPAAPVKPPGKYTGAKDPSKPVGPGNPPRELGFQKGKSGNPKGYPKGVPNTKTLIKYWLGIEEDIANPLNPSEIIRVKTIDVMTLGVISKARKGDVQAYNALLDRIEGKPVQSTKLLGADDKTLEIRVGFAPPMPQPQPNTKTKPPKNAK